MYEVYPDVSLTSNKSGISLTSGSMAYIVGTLAGNTFTVDSAVFTMAPTLPDDKLYIPVGLLSSTNTIYFQSSKEIYKFDSLRGFGLIQNAAIVGKTTEYALSIYYDVCSKISSITYNYKVTSEDVEPDASAITQTSPPSTSETNKYLWQKRTVTYTDSSVSQTVDINKIEEYASGRTVSSIAYTYILTATDTVPSASASGWSSSVPEITSINTHLWQKEVITYVEPTVDSITNIRQIYVDWSESVTSITKDGYLWSREKVIFVIGEPAYTEPVCISRYTAYIVQPDLEAVKEYSFRQAAGLVKESEDSIALKAENTYVTKTLFTEVTEGLSSDISVKADATRIETVENHITEVVDPDLGTLKAWKTTVGQRFEFKSTGLYISAVEGSPFQTVFTNSDWQLVSGGNVLQAVSADKGARFSSLSITNLSGQNGKLVLGDLTITVEDNGNIIGRKTG
jgi:hypothetical protein